MVAHRRLRIRTSPLLSSSPLHGRKQLPGAGLWEMAATDRAGEIYHSWFDFPAQLYYRLVALANRLEEPFVRQATQWSGRSVAADLPRLRQIRESLGRWPIELLADAAPGYSTQDGRRKLANDFVLVGDVGSLRRPKSLRDLTSGPIWVSDFVAPGKYSFSQRKRFDVSFLAEPLEVEVRRVLPRTQYQAGPVPASKQANTWRSTSGSGSTGSYLATFPSSCWCPTRTSPSTASVWGSCLPTNRRNGADY